jgi:hypothetical protein
MAPVHEPSSRNRAGEAGGQGDDPGVLAGTGGVVEADEQVDALSASAGQRLFTVGERRNRRRDRADHGPRVWRVWQVIRPSGVRSPSRSDTSQRTPPLRNADGTGHPQLPRPGAPAWPISTQNVGDPA